MTVHQCDSAKSPGQPIEIGDLLSAGIEPTYIIGRVVGFIKVNEKGEDDFQVLFRRYRNGTERWPSGSVHSRRPAYGVWPHQHFGDSPCRRMLADGTVVPLAVTA